MFVRIAVSTKYSAMFFSPFGYLMFFPPFLFLAVLPLAFFVTIVTVNKTLYVRLGLSVFFYRDILEP